MRTVLSFLLALVVLVTLSGSAISAPPNVWHNPIDGATMVLIPAGAFMMGSADGQGDSDEKPRHEVTVRSFYMATVPVTNAQFATFLNATHPKPAAVKSMVALRGQMVRPTEIRLVKGRYEATPGYQDHPVIAVSYAGAQAYCRWSKTRLPSEEEWEYAARGGLTDKMYPWGNESPDGRANFGRAWSSGKKPAPTTRVGSFKPNGYGLYDMAGNTGQWTSSAYVYYLPGNAVDLRAPFSNGGRVLRGGSWYDSPFELRTSYRVAYPPDLVSNFFNGLGFRCCRDL